MHTSPIKNWRETKKIHEQLGKVGKIITWTKIYVAPSGFELEIPYLVAIVEFEKGKRMSVQVVNCDESEIREGMKVKTVVRRIGKTGLEEVIDYGIKVAPI
jgi:uncharacterized OB-fold protein